MAPISTHFSLNNYLIYFASSYADESTLEGLENFGVDWSLNEKAPGGLDIPRAFWFLLSQ
jgi:hypothetical protein